MCSFEEKYGVQSHGGIRYTLKIVHKNCDCCESTLFHRSCKHVMTTMKLAMHMKTFVDPHIDLNLQKIIVVNNSNSRLSRFPAPHCQRFSAPDCQTFLSLVSIINNSLYTICPMY